MNILAIIPARSGSRGIPDKNKRLFAGKPLIAHTIDVAKRSPSISRVVVSTDADEIAAVARKFGAEVPFLRPKELASNRSPVVDTVVHLLLELKIREAYEPDALVLLQPTSPLRTPADVEGVVALVAGGAARAAVSVCRTEQLVFVKDERGILRPASDERLFSSTNRQQLPPTYRLDGSMVYCIETFHFLEKRSFIPAGVAGYEIPRWRAVDLDEVEDFVVGELIYTHRSAIEARIKKFQ